MGIYTDAIDIRQHIRGGERASVPQIQEIMDEMESWVGAELDIDPLPPNNPILRAIIRELSTSRIILDILPVSAENLSRADMHERRGMRLLESAKREGIAPTDFSSRDPAKEVYNPHNEVFFPREMFEH